MNTQEIRKQLNEIEAGIKTLRERTNEVERKLTERKGKWKPSHGEKYFYVSPSGDIRIFHSAGDSIERGCISTGNYYRTEAEATLARDNLITHEELSRLADWDGTGDYYIIVSHKDDGIKAGWCNGKILYRYDEPRFASKESAQAAIEQIGEARLRKYLVGE